MLSTSEKRLQLLVNAFVSEDQLTCGVMRKLKPRHQYYVFCTCRREGHMMPTSRLAPPLPSLALLSSTRAAPTDLFLLSKSSWRASTSHPDSHHVGDVVENLPAPCRSLPSRANLARCEIARPLRSALPALTRHPCADFCTQPCPYLSTFGSSRSVSGRGRSRRRAWST